MYRAITYKAIQQGINLTEENKIADIVQSADIILEGEKIFLDGKDISEEIVTVVGGPQMSVFPKETVAMSSIDFGVYGEGEYTMAKLLECLEKNKNYKNINGLVYKKSNKIFINSPAIIKHLDEL
ncbi:MAG: (d)CMP kinase, partial [Candidatus Methanomethylicia archaeon]